MMGAAWRGVLCLALVGLGSASSCPAMAFWEWDAMTGRMRER
jgi:hypothetical protein